MVESGLKDDGGLGDGTVGKVFIASERGSELRSLNTHKSQVWPIYLYL